MKDQNDTQTIDALDAPRRGRPKSSNALSNAEKQRAYRERNKDLRSLKLTKSEASELLRALNNYRLSITFDLDRCNALVPLENRLLKILAVGDLGFDSSKL